MLGTAIEIDRGFRRNQTFAKNKQIPNPYTKVSLSDPQASFIIWQYMAYMIMTLDFDCSLNMHELIDQAGM